LTAVGECQQPQKHFTGATPPARQGDAPVGFYVLTDLETVNLYNGNLNLALPVHDVIGRGDATSALVLPIERRWNAVYEAFN
jgi:hypothetical protein